MSEVASSAKASWVQAIRSYLLASVILHVAWEIAQLPLYTIWATGTLLEIVFAVAHCSIGDLMIAGLALLLALSLLAPASWPRDGRTPVVLLALVLGVSYTIYSEWLNVNLRRSWSYGPLMPIVPLLGTGLAPLAQWLIVPSLALWWSTRNEILRITARSGATRDVKR